MEKCFACFVSERAVACTRSSVSNNGRAGFGGERTGKAEDLSLVAQESISREELDGYPRWFALRVKTRFEKTVSMALRNKGIEEFLPLYRCDRSWSDRVKPVDVPLFPNYLFCRIEPERRLPVLTTPGVLHFVGVGKTPIPIHDGEICAIQSVVQTDLKTEPWPFLEVGQKVRVENGPLSGLEGLLVEVRKNHRIIVSISLLRRSVAAEIDRNWVRPLLAS